MKKTDTPFFFLAPWPLAIASVILLAISYIYFDRPIAEYFHTSPWQSSPSVQLFSDFLAPTTQIIGWSVLFFIFRFLFVKKSSNRLWLVSLAVTVGYFAAILIKCVLGRYRPELWFEHGHYGFLFFAINEPELSFPSGHATVTGAALGAWGCRHPRLSVPFFLLSIVLSFVRVILGVHYLSDVLAGVILGTFVSQWIYLCMHKQQIKFS